MSKGGRKKLPKEDKYTARIVGLFTEAEAEAIKAMAQSRRMSTAYLVRLAVHNHITQGK